ncbi:MAG: hypothetical protein AMXMBFR47_14070 [Planctomycetota bacterium]
MTANPPNPAFTFAKLAAISLGLAAAFAVLAFGPASAIGGNSQVAAMLFGTLAALIGSLMAAAAPAWCIAASAQTFAMATLAGLIIRFLATMSLALGLRSLDVVPADALMIWAAVAQLALLAGDVAFLVRLAKTREAKTA